MKIKDKKKKKHKYDAEIILWCELISLNIISIILVSCIMVNVNKKEEYLLRMKKKLLNRIIDQVKEMEMEIYNYRLLSKFNFSGRQ